jgi:hypothetical protein
VERGALSAQSDLVPSPEFRDWLFAIKAASELAERGIPVA